MQSSAAWHRSNIRLNKPFRKLCLPHIRFQSSHGPENGNLTTFLVVSLLMSCFISFTSLWIAAERSRVAAQVRTKGPPFHSLPDHLTPSRIGSYSKVTVVTPFPPRDRFSTAASPNRRAFPEALPGGELRTQQKR